MILDYYGQAFFTLTLASGIIIATDPYQGLSPYPDRYLKADLCTVSHRRYDHATIKTLKPFPQIIDIPGVHTPFPGVRVTGLPTFHGDAEGQKRSSNLAFLIETENLRLVHLGGLKHALTSEQAMAIGQPDILFLPIGGYDTIDAETAYKVMMTLSPRVTIPMSYRAKPGMVLPIAPPEDFLHYFRVSPPPLRFCRITAEDISQRPSLLLMTTPEGY